MNTYTYPKNDELLQRAARHIPCGVYGHQGPAEGCFIPIGAFPKFADHAKGSYFYDVDGNRFLDYMCAYGPNILGRWSWGTASPPPPTRWWSWRS